MFRFIERFKSKIPQFGALIFSQMAFLAKI